MYSFLFNNLTLLNIPLPVRLPFNIQLCHLNSSYWILVTFKSLPLETHTQLTIVTVFLIISSYFGSLLFPFLDNVAGKIFPIHAISIFLQLALFHLLCTSMDINPSATAEIQNQQKTKQNRIIFLLYKLELVWEHPSGNFQYLHSFCLIALVSTECCLHLHGQRSLGKGKRKRKNIARKLCYIIYKFTAWTYLSAVVVGICRLNFGSHIHS